MREYIPIYSFTIISSTDYIVSDL